MAPPHVFLITGTSTGFGAEYVKHILAHGDKVVATARQPDGLKFEGGTEGENLTTCRLDVTDKASIKEAFEHAKTTFGRVDIVVNNAGYGLAGCFEELSEEQIRRQMEINFFGLVCCISPCLATYHPTPHGDHLTSPPAR